jgi:cytochrome c-type biogenesis protein CcmH/NrfG
VQALLDLARIQSSRRDAAGAFDTLGRARKLAPNSEDVLGAYAQMALARHAPVPAILALEPLTRMAPSEAQYHYLHGVALMQAGDMEAGAEALQRAEKLEPNRTLTLIALGLALNSRKLHAESKAYLCAAWSSSRTTSRRSPRSPRRRRA